MRFTIALFLTFVMSGCGILQSSRTSNYVKEQRAKNLDPYHIYSCGPEALRKVFLRFGIYISAKDLSHIVQSDPSCANLLREIACVFSMEGRRITFPTELKSILKKHGFRTVNVSDLEELSQEKDTALVLIKKKSSLSYHWMCFPVDKNIKTFFGKDTIIKEIYLIKK
jgi:hypothetical protein